MGWYRRIAIKIDRGPSVKVIRRGRGPAGVSVVEDAETVDGPASLAFFAGDDGVDLELFDLGVLDGDEDDLPDNVLDGVDVALGQSACSGQELERFRGGDHLVQLLFGQRDVPLGDLPKDLDVDTSETERHDGTELLVLHHGKDDLWTVEHLLDGYADDGRFRCVLGDVAENVLVGFLGLFGALDPDHDTADIGFVLDVGRYDLHDDRISDLVGGRGGLCGGFDDGRTGHGYSVGLEHLLSFGLGEHVASLFGGGLDKFLDDVAPGFLGHHECGLLLLFSDAVGPQDVEGADGSVGSGICKGTCPA